MWKRIVLGIVVLVLAVAGFFAYQIGPRNLIGMALYDQRREGDLKVGDAAPDVKLVAIDGAPATLKESLAGKPLVLVFGSFT